jgi:hypothetical protein
VFNKQFNNLLIGIEQWPHTKGWGDSPLSPSSSLDESVSSFYEQKFSSTSHILEVVISTEISPVSVDQKLLLGMDRDYPIHQERIRRCRHLL